MLEDVSTFLKINFGAVEGSVAPLVEGHASQAFKFRTTEGEYVCRLAAANKDFQADLFAFRTFGNMIPIPKVIAIDKFDGDSFYCITDFASGKTVISLTDAEMSAALPSIQQALGQVYTADITRHKGYGDIDTATGNAEFTTWKENLLRIRTIGRDSFKRNAENIGLESSLIDRFFEQYESNLSFASEERRLLHGDPAFDNMLVENNHVTAVIDWAQMGYGDWMSDFARLDFWWPDRYGDAKEFAQKYQLEAENIDERKALYWATNALWTIEFADNAKSAKVTEWLHEYIEQKII